MWSDLTFGPLLQGRTRILHLQYFFEYVLSYSLHLNSYLVTFLHNTICRAQLFCPFLLSGSEFLLNMLFNYHLLYFRTALSLIIMLSSHYYLHKSKTLSQLTQCPFTGTLLLLRYSQGKILKVRVTTARSEVKYKPDHHVAYLYPLIYPNQVFISYTLWFPRCNKNNFLK